MVVELQQCCLNLDFDLFILPPTQSKKRKKKKNTPKLQPDLSLCLIDDMEALELSPSSSSPKPTHFSHAASVVNWNAFTLLPSEDDGFWNDCGSASSNSTPTSSLTPASPEPHQFLASRKYLFDDLHINSSLDHFTHSMPSTSSNNRSPLPFYPRSPASAVKVDDDGWKNSPSNSQSRRRSRRRRSHKFDCAMMFEVEMDSSPTSSPIATSPPPLFASSPLQFSPAALSPTPPHRLQSFRPKQHQQPSTNELKQRIDKRLRSMIKKNRRHADLMEEVVKLEGLIRLEISKSLQLHQSGDRSGGFVWQNGQAGILKDFAAAICQYHELQLKGNSWDLPVCDDYRMPDILFGDFVMLL